MCISVGQYARTQRALRVCYLMDVACLIPVRSPAETDAESGTPGDNLRVCGAPCWRLPAIALPPAREAQGTERQHGKATDYTTLKALSHRQYFL